MFARSDVRDAHEREIHKNGMIGSHFRCNECNAAFDLRDELMSHKILSHFSGVIHTCEVNDYYYYYFLFVVIIFLFY